VRRRAFFRVEELEKAIMEFLEAWNDDPKPFVWTATVESIMEKLSRLSSDPGTNSTRLHPTTQPKEEESVVQLITGSYAGILPGQWPLFRMRIFPCCCKH